MEYDQIITIKHIISPSMLKNDGWKETVVQDVVKKYNRMSLKTFFIKNVNFVNIRDAMSGVVTDPISGNLQMNIKITCNCLKIDVNDELMVEVVQINDKGILCVGYEGIVQTLISGKYLNEWTYNNQTWSNKEFKSITIKKGDRIMVTVIGYELLKNTIRCSAKIFKQN